MFKSFSILVLSAVAASAAPVHAQTSPPIGSANAAMVWPIIDASDTTASSDGPYACAYASTPRDSGRPRTAIDYRFAADGLVGSVGYVRVDNSRPRESQEGSLAESSRFAPLGSLVGATLSYVFR